MQQPHIGEQLGHWVLAQRLGKGAVAQVFLAHHQYIQERKAAIKVLSRATDEIGRERFLREAQAINTLDHPNIVKLIDFAIEEGSQAPYMVQEFLQGYNLRQLLSQQSILPKGMVWLIVQQICAGLAAVHNAGIVHRDLKPSNIFLLPDSPPFPLVKIIDFGIAKQLDPRAIPIESEDAGGIKNLTGKLVLGTLSYLAPEQADTQQEVTPQADIYAIGVMLYEMLTGQVPLKGSGFLAHSLELLREQRPYARIFRPDLAHTALEDLMFRMIQKAPQQRPTSPDALLEELGLALAEWHDLHDPDAPAGRVEFIETQRAAGWRGPEAPEAAWVSAPLLQKRESIPAEIFEEPNTFSDAMDETYNIKHPPPNTGPPTLETLSNDTSPEAFALASSPDTAIAPAPRFIKSEAPASVDAPKGESVETDDTISANARGIPTWLLAMIVIVSALILGVIAALLWLPDAKLNPRATCLTQGISPQAKEKLQRLLSVYQRRNLRHFRDTQRPRKAWNLAQMTMALQGLYKPDNASLVARKILASRMAACHCYPRMRNGKEPSTFVTAWATLALLTVDANRYHKDILLQLQHLLDTQNLAGYWAIHPQATKLSSNASIYATVLSTWAFHEAIAHKELLRLTPQRLAQLQSAKRQAIRWLYTARWQERPRWKAYPFNPANEVSSSITAMAIFALSLSATKHASAHYANLTQAWVQELGQTTPARMQGKQSQDFHLDLQVRLPKRLLVDPTRYLKLPWQITAAHIVYPTLPRKHRKRLLTWIDKAILQLSLEHKEDWRVAMTLFGFRKSQCQQPDAR